MRKTRIIPLVLGILSFTAVFASAGQWPSIQNQDPGYYPDKPAGPSSRMVVYSGRNVEFRYPDNWRVVENSNSLTVVPAGGFASAGLAYGLIVSAVDPHENPYRGDSLNVFSGSEVVANVSDAANTIISRLRQTNPEMRFVRNMQKTRVGGLDAMTAEVQNNSPLGGYETDWLVVVLRPSGVIQYFVGVAPQLEFDDYRAVFEQIMDSVRFSD